MFHVKRARTVGERKACGIERGDKRLNRRPRYCSQKPANIRSVQVGTGLVNQQHHRPTQGCSDELHLRESQCRRHQLFLATGYSVLGPAGTEHYPEIRSMGSDSTSRHLQVPLAAIPERGFQNSVVSPARLVV